MPKGRRGLRVDASLLEAALIGCEQMRRQVDEKIAELRQRLGTGRDTRSMARVQSPRRTLSAAARAKIAAAQRKRWAAVKGKVKAVTTKRTMSAAARKRIAAAQRKRWAAVKKAQAKAARKKTAPKKAVTKAAQTAAAAS